MSNLREDYTARIKQQLDELNRKVDALESRANEVRAELRESYRQELARLHHQSELAADKLEQIKEAGSASWDRLVQEMDGISDAFKDALSRFKSKF